MFGRWQQNLHPAQRSTPAAWTQSQSQHEGPGHGPSHTRPGPSSEDKITNAGLLQADHVIIPHISQQSGEVEWQCITTK